MKSPYSTKSFAAKAARLVFGGTKWSWEEAPLVQSSTGARGPVASW